MRMTRELDRVFDGDLKFFKDQQRNYRVRVASAAELEEEAVTAGRVLTPNTWPAEMGRPRVYVAVRQVRPGVLRRLFFVAAEGMPTAELTEDQAQALFEHLMAQASSRPADASVH
jgi:hypothetical protein